MRRIGIIFPAVADDPVFQAWLGAFLQALALLGWTTGRNVRIDTRWATANPAEIRQGISELLAFAPDVIVAYGSSTVEPLLQATRTIPIVFPVVGDPVAAGFIDSLARPGGNATGFMTTEYSMAGKLLELLKQVAPRVTRLAVLRNSATPTGPAQFGIIQAMAPSLKVEVSPINVRDAAEIERGINAFARSSNDGLIVTPGGPAARHRDLIVALAARHNLPAVYFERSFVDVGGLVSYGADYLDQFRRTAGYVDPALHESVVDAVDGSSMARAAQGDRTERCSGCRHLRPNGLQFETHARNRGGDRIVRRAAILVYYPKRLRHRARHRRIRDSATRRFDHLAGSIHRGPSRSHHQLCGTARLT